ncbi:hypothetical protein T484DRAFT_1926580 [Baffinella frigidus]|nr:hypothetical protein T484DRAFT_1926580 [Cryptophyta sp. CCMP2293]
MVASTPPVSMVCQRSSRHTDGHVLVYADDLKRMFHLPIADAACKIGLCQTTFKKTCRRLGISAWPYKKGANRHAAYKDAQIVTPLPSLRRQSLSSPTNITSTPWTEEEHDDSAMYTVWSRTESVSSFFPTEEWDPAAVSPGDLSEVEREAGGGCIEAVLDYLEDCELGMHSGFLVLLEDELVRDGHLARS